jgi:hypothetical protein
MYSILKYFIVAVLVALVTFVSLAQPATNALINNQRIEKDSLKNLLHKAGKFEGHLRNFFMSTTNHDDYPDYYALAVGGGIGYYSPIIKGFQAGLSGFVVSNVTSSSLVPSSPYSNRYEVRLFDITNPESREVLNRLEDLYLRYYLTKKINHSYRWVDFI